MKAKYFYFIFPLIVMMLFSSCKTFNNAVKAKSPALDKAFSSNVTIKNDELTIKAILTRYGTGIWDMEITEPAAIAGLIISSSPNGINATLGELELNMELEDLSNESIFLAVWSTIDNAAANETLDFTHTERGLEYSGTAQNGSYTLIFDPETNALSNIIIPELGIEVTVEDMKELSSNIHDVTETTAEVQTEAQTAA